MMMMMMMLKAVIKVFLFAAVLLTTLTVAAAYLESTIEVIEMRNDAKDFAQSLPLQDKAASAVKDIWKTNLARIPQFTFNDLYTDVISPATYHLLALYAEQFVPITFETIFPHPDDQSTNAPAATAITKYFEEKERLVDLVIRNQGGTPTPEELWVYMCTEAILPLLDLNNAKKPVKLDKLQCLIILETLSAPRTAHLVFALTLTSQTGALKEFDEALKSKSTANVKISKPGLEAVKASYATDNAFLTAYASMLPLLAKATGLTWKEFIPLSTKKPSKGNLMGLLDQSPFPPELFLQWQGIEEYLQVNPEEDTEFWDPYPIGSEWSGEQLQALVVDLKSPSQLDQFVYDSVAFHGPLTDGPVLRNLSRLVLKLRRSIRDEARFYSHLLTATTFESDKVENRLMDFIFEKIFLVDGVWDDLCVDGGDAGPVTAALNRFTQFLDRFSGDTCQVFRRQLRGGLAACFAKTKGDPLQRLSSWLKNNMTCQMDTEEGAQYELIATAADTAISILRFQEYVKQVPPIEPLRQYEKVVGLGLKPLLLDLLHIDPAFVVDHVHVDYWRLLLEDLTVSIDFTKIRSISFGLDQMRFILVELDRRLSPTSTPHEIDEVKRRIEEFAGAFGFLGDQEYLRLGLVPLPKHANLSSLRQGYMVTGDQDDMITDVNVSLFNWRDLLLYWKILQGGIYCSDLYQGVRRFAILDDKGEPVVSPAGHHDLVMNCLVERIPAKLLEEPDIRESLKGISEAFRKKSTDVEDWSD